MSQNNKNYHPNDPLPKRQHVRRIPQSKQAARDRALATLKAMKLGKELEARP